MLNSKNRFLLFLAFFLYTLPLLSSDQTIKSEFFAPSSLTNTAGLVSSIVNGSVNVISGDFIDSQIEVAIPGPEPLVLQRSYCSSDDTRCFFCRSWKFNHPQLFHVNVEGRAINVHAGEDSGSIVSYSVKNVKGDELRFSNNKQKGLTNCFGEEISSRTNLKNNILKINKFKVEDEDKCNYELFSGKGSRRLFKPSLTEPGFAELVNEIKPNGNIISYTYQNSLGELLLSTIYTSDLASTIAYNGVSFSKTVDSINNPLCFFDTSDGKRITYHFANQIAKHSKRWTYIPYLTKIENPFHPTVTFHYVRKAYQDFFHIDRKELPDGRFVENKYYGKSTNDVPGIGNVNVVGENDFHLNRVKAQYAPVGNDKNPIVTHRYLYHENTDKSGHTEVFDAHLQKTVYIYTKEHRLSVIQKFQGRFPNHTLYRQQEFIWGGEGSQDEGNLIGIYLKDYSEKEDVAGKKQASGKIVSARIFTYDAAGNIVSDRFYGNLSGKESPSIVLGKNGLPIENGAESYTKTYTYFTQHITFPTTHTHQFSLLQSEREDNGRGISYTYHPNTDRIASQLITVNGAIKIRHFFEYDQYNNLIQKITDNGTSALKDDTSGITERYITDFVVKATPPAMGVPIEQKEYCIDFSTGQQNLVKTTSNTFSNEGKLTHQIINANGIILSREWKYDLHGNLLEETNPLGETITRTYDANDNLITETDSRRSKEIAYDKVNRPTSETVTHSDGTKLTTTFSYDYLSNLLTKTNSFGHQVENTFDEFGRKTFNKLPAIPNSKKELVPVGGSFKYDVLDNLIFDSNGCNEVTTKEFNARNQPIKIVFPDGSKEFLAYHLDGNLAEKIEKNGSKTRYQYDCLNRILKKEQFSSKDELLTVQTYTYNSFHLLSETDPEGFTTSYSYDCQGRKISETKCNSQITYEYDALNRISKIKEWFNDAEYSAKVFVYDNLNRIIEERTEDNLGNILKRSAYGYDVDGNKIEISHYTSIGLSTTTSEFDSHGKPIRIIDPLGHETLYRYNYQAKNDYGQTVLEITKTDPMGQITVTTMNAQGKEGKLSKRNSQGEELYSRESLYDGRGCCAIWKERITSPNQPERLLTTKFVYNGVNQLTKQIEAFGTSDEKTTLYTYNQAGQKESVIKPDGTILNYRYDALGRLSSLTSSDQSINYSYTYDRNNNLLSVTDLNSQATTFRTYDGNGNMTSETLSTGLTMLYSYDRVGRLTQTTLPDQSKIIYNYDAANLKNVQRLSSTGELLYTHHYEYDTAENIVKESLPHNSGEINFSYNLKQSLTSIDAPHWKEQISYDAMNNIIATTIEDKLGKIDSKYSYDDLYQITSEEGIASHKYSFDSLNNRTQKDGIDYSINATNQLLSQGDCRYSYSASGNMTKKESVQGILEYSYDALDRLISVKMPGREITYSYDPFNRRLTKSPNIGTVRYLYQGQNEIGSLDEEGNFLELRILGIGEGDSEIGATVAIELNKCCFVPIHDHNGNIVSLLDTEGTVKENYRYSAFGEENQIHAIQNPWRFSSKRHDIETGFIYFGRRFYSPSIGRWITTDPLGFQDGPNLYAYVHNNPLNSYDLYGLYSWSQFGSDSWYTSKCGTRGLYNGFMHPVDTWNANSNRIVNVGYCAANRDFRSVTNSWNNMSGCERVGYATERVGETVGTGLLFASAVGRVAYQAGDFALNSIYRMGQKFTGLFFEKKSAGYVAESTAGKTLTNVARNESEISKQIWSSTKNENSAQNAFRHWNDHRHDFPELQNAKQYVEKTWSFVKSPPKGTLIKTRSSNGDIIFYHHESNTFGVANRYGIPKTMYKPNPEIHKRSSNLEYFYEQ